MSRSAQLSCDYIAVPLDQYFDGCGWAIEKFLFDSFEAVIAEVLELVLFDEGQSRRAVVGLLGCGVVVGQLTFDVTDILHYFNINFIYLPAFHTKVYNRLIVTIIRERIRKEFKNCDFIAYVLLCKIMIIYHMRVIVLLTVIAVVFAQFDLPDFGKIGQTIKNGVVQAQQKVEHLAKEEIQNAGDLINKGLQKVNEVVNPPAPQAPAPAVVPVPAPQPAEKQLTNEPKPAIITQPVVVAPLSSQPVPVPQAEIKVEAQEKPVQDKEVPTPTQNLAQEEKKIEKPEKKAKEEKPRHAPKHKPRKEQKSSESQSSDIEQKREKHAMKEAKKEAKRQRKQRRQYSTEEIQRWREERERKMRKKEQHMRKYEKRNKNIERNEDDSRKEWQRFHDAKKNHNQHSPKNTENPELERIKEVVKLAVLP